MSTSPPEPPPIAPPAVNPLPWEARESRGFLEAFFDTMGLFFSRPQEAWARTRESGDIASPLLFGTIISWFSLAIHSIISSLVTVPFVLPGPLARRLGMMGGPGFMGVSLVPRLILAPILILIVLFIGAAILHVCCLIVGALTKSQSGFEGTFRVVAYSQVSSLASIIPIVGHLIHLVWWIVFAVMGVQRLHRTSQGKAATAVLIPVIVCCGGIALIGLLAGAAFLARGAR